jgi:hypothetical protein
MKFGANGDMAAALSKPYRAHPRCPSSRGYSVPGDLPLSLEEVAPLLRA